MKYFFSICLGSLFAFAMAYGQVASHQQSQPQSPAPAQAQSQFSVPSAYLRPAGKPVARVNGVVLTDVDLVREEYVIFPYAKQHDGKIPASFEPDLRKGALQMIIFEELVYQDAVKRGITVSPEKLKKDEADFRKQFSTSAEYQQYLQSEFQG